MLIYFANEWRFNCIDLARKQVDYKKSLKIPHSIHSVCKFMLTLFLQNCHKHEALRDEVYCQVMKQTTNNKSSVPESCQRGWRLFSVIAAYFTCSEILKPYLLKYLETNAYDKRRAFHGKHNQRNFLLCTRNKPSFKLKYQCQKSLFIIN